MAPDTLTITDNRTGKVYELPIEKGMHGAAVRSLDLRRIRASEEDTGLMAYDPSFRNTASCKSAITYIDGERGILEYRGYPIEQIAEQSTFLEVAFLILFGKLPTQAELKAWGAEITAQSTVPVTVQRLISSFQRDAHPMGVLLSAVGALSTVYPDARNVTDAASRRLQTVRAIAQVPVLAALAYRHSRILPYVYPEASLTYAGNFVNMVFRPAKGRSRPDPVIEQAMDILFILHADHEQNCSANAVRSVGSSQSDTFSALAGGIAALSGPLHGGANEAVIRMLMQIGSKDRIPAFIASVKRGEGRLMGFGHPVYRAYDPRARIIKRTAEQVIGVMGTNPLLEVGMELERIALEDEYFISRRLYPNIDFYTGVIYQSLGFPPEMFTALFAVPRTVGWLAQWNEMLADPEQRIARPSQVYTGAARRDYAPLGARG